MISLEGMYDFKMHPAPSIQKRRFTAFKALVQKGCKYQALFKNWNGLIFPELFRDESPV